ncbi:hypothetical protein L6164_031291 [Bauhinia variegata]|uniref:Uncharacterized protein n=1 Tax=Bauhinia variegata TaxID=167791 RepID=A0ACB9LFE2_BAUVA|nr:hypothetical protein L6164_031291 [Bauhinia variegata]
MRFAEVAHVRGVTGCNGETINKESTTSLGKQGRRRNQETEKGKDNAASSNYSCMSPVQASAPTPCTALNPALSTAFQLLLVLLHQPPTGESQGLSASLATFYILPQVMLF